MASFSQFPLSTRPDVSSLRRSRSEVTTIPAVSDLPFVLMFVWFGTLGITVIESFSPRFR